MADRNAPGGSPEYGATLADLHMATVLVTGCCGGVDSWTVDLFADAGREVAGPAFL